MKEELSIYGTTINLGEYKVVMLPMPGLYDAAPLSLPVHIIRGKKPGPTLCLTAAIHGDELNGIEIIRRIIRRVTPNKISGTLIAIPIVNIYGFLYQDRYLMDRRDLNRSFPGTESGSLASRLAHLISKEVISKSTHCIDLHTGSLHRSNLPQIRADVDNQETWNLAKSFNTSVVLDSKLRDGSLRQFASENGIPFLLYEAGQSLRFEEISIKTGVSGILNVMHTLNMMKKRKYTSPAVTPTIARNSYWLRASQSGIILSKVILGAKVNKGDLLAKIGNPTGIDEVDLCSPVSGIIIGKNNLPMVHAGAAVFHIATFDNINIVEDNIENIQEHYDEYFL